MLRLHFLNVGHGDSIVIEYVRSDASVFGVVDSNTSRNTDPPVLHKLAELGARTLSFVCITHPHADHYKGIYDLFKCYKGSIESFYTFPLGDVVNNNDRLKKLAKQYLQLYEGQDDPEITYRSKEFLQIIYFAKQNFLDQGNWFEVSGSFERLAPPGFDGLEIYAVQPPNRAKGSYFQKIENGTLELSENLQDNTLSIALLIKYSCLLYTSDAADE